MILLVCNILHGDTCKIEGVHDVERVVHEKSKTWDAHVKGGGHKFTNFAGVEIEVKVEVNCASLVSSLDT